MERFCVKLGWKNEQSIQQPSKAALVSMPDKPYSEASPDAPEPFYKARIAPGLQFFDAPADLPLLQAAERAGLPVVSSCRNGTCRACICQMTSGQVVYRIKWPGLSLEEKQTGCALPCVAYPVSDVVFARIW